MNSEEVEYYRITKDWQIISGDSPETVNSDATLYWIKVYKSGRTYTTNYNNTYRLRNFDLFDRNEKEALISKENFSIQGIVEDYATAFGSSFEVAFKDKFGKSRKLRFNQWRLAIEELDELDEFHSWIEYDLKHENQQLTSKIETLEEEKRELENEIESLKAEIAALKKAKRTVKPRTKKS